MLEKTFLQVLNMSFTAGFVIIPVLIARLLLRKSPKILSYALWGVVLFRLICPFSFESILSLLPVKSDPITQDIVYEAIPAIDTGIGAINHAVNQFLPSAAPAASVNPLQIWTFIGSTVWLMGMAVLLIYSFFSLVKLQKRLKHAVHEKENIYIAEHLDTPFVMGFIRPKIYLPASLSKGEKRYILLHERMHIRRFDHVIKIVSFFVLCLHWFNPLVWMAFLISGKDMEMSCDEAVIKELGSDVKKEYSSSLLALATGRRVIGGSPLAFGEGDTKGRIKNVLNYKKPGFWVVVISFVVVVALSISLLTNPKQTPINLPAKDEVFGIQIEQVNEGESLGVVQITETSDIETILMALQNTNKTLKKSYNDAPGRRDYFRIYIDGTTLQRLYLYNDANKYYIEEAYVGIYKTSRETSVSIAKVYTSNGGAYLENSVTTLWNARTKYVGDTLDQAVALALASSSNRYREGECFAEGHIILGTDKERGATKIYALTMTGWYGFQNDNFVKVSGTGVIPAVVTISDHNDVSIEYPEDGSYYAPSIRKMFPLKYHTRIFDDKDGDGKTLKKQEQAYAKDYLSKIGRKAEIGDYGDFEYTLLTDLGVSVEVSNKLEDFYKEHSNYPYFIGTQEYIENNLRMVYQMSYREDQREIEFTRYAYDSKEILEQFTLDATTGDRITLSEGAPRANS